MAVKYSLTGESIAILSCIPLVQGQNSIGQTRQGKSSSQLVSSFCMVLSFNETLHWKDTKFHNMYTTLRTGFHVKSKCLNVGRVPAGFWPAAWAGAADLLGRVSQTRTVLKSKHKKQISFLKRSCFAATGRKYYTGNLFLLHLSLLGLEKSIKRWKDVTETWKPIAFSFTVANIIIFLLH